MNHVSRGRIGFVVPTFSRTVVMLLVVVVCAKSGRAEERSTQITPLIVSTAVTFGLYEDVGRIENIFKDSETFFASKTVTVNKPVKIISPKAEIDLISKIRTLQVDAKTTLVCYLKLHGAYDSEGKHILYLDGYKPFVRREKILHELKLRGARLTILITDSCSLLHTEVPSGGTQAEVLPAQLLWDLFVESQGVVDINSSSLGELAFVDPDGAIFTRVLNRALTAGDPTTVTARLNSIDRKPNGNGNGRYSWDEFFPYLSRETDDLYQTYRSVVAEKGFLQNGGTFYDSAAARKLIKCQDHLNPKKFAALPAAP